MMKRVEQIEDCYEWGKENLDLPLSNVENEDFEYLISTIKHLHTENERLLDDLDIFKNDFNEQRRMARKYRKALEEIRDDEYARYCYPASERAKKALEGLK